MGAVHECSGEKVFCVLGLHKVGMKLLRPEEVASVLGVSRSSARRLMVENILPTVTIRSGRRKRILRVQGPDELETAFATITKARAGALIVLQGPLTGSYRKKIVELAVKSRLLTTYHESEFVEIGGLMSYGTNVSDLYRRAAIYVDKILKGAKPADLPVEQPKKFELIINLKTAKQIGLTIPPNVLARADRVIK
jgi:ABC transporter substrate binding protein/Helix-turn-helix domain